VASVRITSSGIVRFLGSMADGSKFTGSSRLSQGLEWPLFAPLYNGRGLVFGRLAFTNSTITNFQGDVFWAKPALPGAAEYPAGFAATNAAFGFPYSKPPTGQPVLNFTQATLVSGGPISPELRTPVALDGRNRLATKQPGELKASVNRSTGLMKGRLFSPGASHPISLQGAVLQSENVVEGFAIQDGLSSRLLIAP
jgi:hypothetical protein